MKNQRRKFLYLNNKETDGAVFQTQVIDWLSLFKKQGINFELLQLFHIKDIVKSKFVNSQINSAKNKCNIFMGYVFLFPSKGLTAYINTIILFLKLLFSLLRYEKVIIFSRALIGREIKYLKIIFPSKILFVFDGRAASAEENKYTAIKTNDFTKSRYKMIANIYYLEYITLSVADKVFSVSEGLSNYFMETFNISKTRFIKYPCLSDSLKFKFDSFERDVVRKEMNISKNTKVLIYAGGIAAKWHMADYMLLFFSELLKHNKNIIFLFLSNDENGFNQIMKDFQNISSNVLYRKVPNDLVYRYLNAADFGLLFRENTIMNNVASPTKFAEYMLCGLPVLISEGVGDYAKFTYKNNTGLVLKENELLDFTNFNYETFFNFYFDRQKIAELGKKYFAKESIVDSLINVFKND